MKLVVNSNVLFSFFWNDSTTKRVILKPFFDLYAPIFFFKELDKYSNDILSKTKLSKEQFRVFKERLSDVIQFMPEKEYAAFIDEAKSISPDLKDVDFFALALKLNCGIWSNDKGLKQQSKVKVFSTSDLIKEFDL